MIEQNGHCWYRVRYSGALIERVTVLDESEASVVIAGRAGRVKKDQCFPTKEQAIRKAIELGEKRIQCHRAEIEELERQVAANRAALTSAQGGG